MAEEINIHLHIHVDQDPRIDLILTEVTKQTKKLNSLSIELKKEEKAIMTDLTALTDAVTQDTDAVSSAITLINGLAAEIAAAGTDPVALQSLVDQLNTNSAALAEAVSANTAPPAPPA